MPGHSGHLAGTLRLHLVFPTVLSTKKMRVRRFLSYLPIVVDNGFNGLSAGALDRTKVRTGSLSKLGVNCVTQRLDRAQKAQAPANVTRRLKGKQHGRHAASTYQRGAALARRCTGRGSLRNTRAKEMVAGVRTWVANGWLVAGEPRESETEGHRGWGGNIMSRFFTIIAALPFLSAAAAHAYRLFSHHFSSVVAGHDIPMWASWPAGAVALLLGVMLLVEARRQRILYPSKAISVRARR